MKIMIASKGDKPCPTNYKANEIGADTDIIELAKQAAEFSDKTFGDPKVRGPLGALHHLREEIEELVDNPTDRMEYADCLLLLIDAYRRNGGNVRDLIRAGFEKLEINKKRNWGKADQNGVIRHI